MKTYLIVFMLIITFVFFVKLQKVFVVSNNLEFVDLEETSFKKLIVNNEGKKIMKVTPEKELSDKEILSRNLQKIYESEKISFDEQTIQEKWIMNHMIIDKDLENKVSSKLNTILDGVGFFNDKFHIQTIDNMYFMKDDKERYRIIVSFYIYDILNFHTIKLLVDFVSIEDKLAVNYINLDESSLQNILNEYDIVWNHQGILANYDIFDENIMKRFDNYYKDNSHLVYLNDRKNPYINMDNLFITQNLNDTHLPNNHPELFSPMFCNNPYPNWKRDSTTQELSKDCILSNSSTTPYPNYPYDSPGVVTKRVDKNKYDWLNNPARGNLMSRGNHL